MKWIVAGWGITTFFFLVLPGMKAIGSQPLLLPEISSVADLTGNSDLVSTNGKPIVVYSFTPESKKIKYRMLVQGGIHGNEPVSPRFIKWLTKRYSKGVSPLNKLSKHGIALDFLPEANPDGLAYNDRYNARGVNLNRNFSTLWGTTRENPGAKPFSENESKAIRALFAKQKYMASVDVHGYINWVVAPTPPKVLAELTNKPAPAFGKHYSTWYKALDEEKAMLPNYSLHTAGGLGDGGAFEDWAYWEARTFSACLEIMSDKRHKRSTKPMFENIAQFAPEKSSDQFKRYEEFVYRVFVRALMIKEDIQSPEDFAQLGN